jgi:Fic family protein
MGVPAMSDVGQFNPRHRTLINPNLNGFDGKLTSSKSAAIAKCSPDTELRDITDPMDWNILEKNDAADVGPAIT